MCINETYSKVYRGKNLLDAFPTQNGLKRDALSPLLFKLLQNMPSGRLEMNGTNQLLVWTKNINIINKKHRSPIRG
jgi:hypothetical protein